MKCEYCDAEDHLITACPTKKGQRAFDLVLGCLLILILGPFFLLGGVIGLGAGAMIQGYRISFGAWRMMLHRIKGPSDEPTEI